MTVHSQSNIHVPFIFSDVRKKRQKKKKRKQRNLTRLIHTFAHVWPVTFIEKNFNIYSHLINQICRVLLYFYKCTDASSQLCRSDTTCACKSNITSMLIICDHSSRRNAHSRFSRYVPRLLDWKKRSTTIRRCRRGRHPWRARANLPPLSRSFECTLNGTLFENYSRKLL